MTEINHYIYSGQDEKGIRVEVIPHGLRNNVWVKLEDVILAIIECSMMDGNIDSAQLEKKLGITKAQIDAVIKEQEK